MQGDNDFFKSQENNGYAVKLLMLFYTSSNSQNIYVWFDIEDDSYIFFSFFFKRENSCQCDSKPVFVCEQYP